MAGPVLWAHWLLPAELRPTGAALTRAGPRGQSQQTICLLDTELQREAMDSLSLGPMKLSRGPWNELWAS